LELPGALQASEGADCAVRAAMGPEASAAALVDEKATLGSWRSCSHLCRAGHVVEASPGK